MGWGFSCTKEAMSFCGDKLDVKRSGEVILGDLVVVVDG